jgi:hypothetical protein
MPLCGWGRNDIRTRAGRYTIVHLNLDRELLRLWRTRKHQLKRQIADLEAIEAETDIPPNIRSVLPRNRQRLQTDLQTEYAGWW